MTQKAKAHETEIKTFLAQKDHLHSQKVLAQHLLWIGFLQHERLIHLIITLFFGFLVTILFLLITIAGVIVWWVVLITFIITILLLFYIWHYYFLENTVQRWYVYADQLRQLE